MSTSQNYQSSNNHNSDNASNNSMGSTTAGALLLAGQQQQTANNASINASSLAVPRTNNDVHGTVDSHHTIDHILQQRIGIHGEGMQRSFHQFSSTPEQAEAAYAAAAMAEKRMGMSSISHQEKSNRPNSANGTSFGENYSNNNLTSLGQNTDSNNSFISQGNNFNLPVYSNMIYPDHQARQLLLNGFLTNGMIGSPFGGVSQGGQIAPQFQMNSADPKLTKKTKTTNAPSGKKKKDKTKPKRPLSAYNWFFKYERARILKEEEAEGEKSKSLPSSNKDENRNQEIDQSKTTTDGASDLPTTKQEEVTTPMEDAPKTSAVDQIALTKKKPHGKIGFENLAKTIGRRWASLDKEKMVRYKELADEDMKRYKKEMEQYLTKLQQMEAKEEEVREMQAKLNDSITVSSNSQVQGLSPQTMVNDQESQFFAQQQQLQLHLQNLQHQQQIQQQLQQIQQIHRLQQDIQTSVPDNAPPTKKQRIETAINTNAGIDPGLQDPQNAYGGNHTENNSMGYSTSNQLLQHYYGGLNTGTSQSHAEPMVHQNGPGMGNENTNSGNTYSQVYGNMGQ